MMFYSFPWFSMVLSIVLDDCPRCLLIFYSYSMICGMKIHKYLQAAASLMWTIGHKLFDPWIPWPKLACVKAGAEGLPKVCRGFYGNRMCNLWVKYVKIMWNKSWPISPPKVRVLKWSHLPTHWSVEDSLFLLVRKFKLTPHGPKTGNH